MHLPEGASKQAKRLWKLLSEAGIFNLGFQVKEILEPDYDNFTKFKLAPDGHRLLSFELYSHKSKDDELKIHHSEKINPELRNELASIPGGRLSPKVGVYYEGDLKRACAGIAGVLGKWTAPTATKSTQPPPPVAAKVDQPNKALHPALSPAKTPNCEDGPRSGFGSAAQLRAINERILAFAKQRENSDLLARTRNHSTPFRGSLGGLFLQTEVGELLERQPVDVLVVGSNPNDVGDTPSATKYRPFQDQIESGFYGEAHWNQEGRPGPGWSPFEDGKPGWQLLTEALREATADRADAFTFANYIPWGSRDLDHLAAKTDARLLDRAVNFADDLFEDVLRVLRPRVVLVVKSLTDNGAIGRRTRLKEHRLDSESLSIAYRNAGGPARMVFDVGAFKAGDFEVPMIHIGHPSRWMIPADQRPAVKMALLEVIR